MIACFRSVWRTDEGERALRKALASLADETLRTRPERREALLVQLAKLDQQIAKGTENVLLLAAADIPAASALLANWRAQRDGLHAELDDAENSKPAALDADAILAELDELEQHLAGDSIPLAKAAIQRVFESVSLYWEEVSPRRRELVRAEIRPRFPFCLTGSTSSRSAGRSQPGDCTQDRSGERRFHQGTDTANGAVPSGTQRNRADSARGRGIRARRNSLQRGLAERETARG